MKAPTLTQTALTLFWVIYAAAGISALVLESASVQRDLLLILGGFTVVAIVATVALLKRDGDQTDTD
jgi:hypothetical protein